MVKWVGMGAQTNPCTWDVEAGISEAQGQSVSHKILFLRMEKKISFLYFMLDFS